MGGTEEKQYEDLHVFEGEVDYTVYVIIYVKGMAESSHQSKHDAKAAHVYTKSNSLFISRIPPKWNNMAHLCHYFSKFGHISYIWSSESVAVVTYTSEESAQAAFDSPTPYANNKNVVFRFHNHPEEVQTPLSSCADLRRVQKIGREMKACLDQQEEEHSRLMEKMAEEKDINSQIDEKKGALNEIMGICEEINGQIDNAQGKEKDEMQQLFKEALLQIETIENEIKELIEQRNQLTGSETT